jgi:hypothetical protein
MRKYQAAYDDALRKAVERKKSILKKPHTSPRKAEEKTVKFARPIVDRKQEPPRYQDFVRDFLKSPNMRNKTGTERMKKAAAEWRKLQK